jgi:hypothetical protein
MVYPTPKPLSRQGAAGLTPAGAISTRTGFTRVQALRDLFIRLFDFLFDVHAICFHFLMESD